MLNDNRYYCIHLEDYSFPRYAAVTRPYFGTMDDIINLMVGLSDNEWTRTRYAETIDAVEYYDLYADASHTVAGKAMPVLEPMEEIYRQEFCLDNKTWNYRAYSGAVCPVRSTEMNVSQLLLSGEEDNLCRCVKICFHGLEVCSNGIGWHYVDNLIRGFPGMVCWDGCSHEMQMYIALQWYRAEEKELAMQDMNDWSKVDLAEACRDILGEV